MRGKRASRLAPRRRDRHRAGGIDRAGAHVPGRHSRIRRTAQALSDLERIGDVDVQNVVDLDRVTVALHADDQAVHRRPGDVPDRLAREERGQQVVIVGSLNRAEVLSVLAAMDPDRADYRPAAFAHGGAATGGQRRECSANGAGTRGGDQEATAHLRCQLSHTRGRPATSQAHERPGLRRSHGHTHRRPPRRPHTRRGRAVAARDLQLAAGADVGDQRPRLHVGECPTEDRPEAPFRPLDLDQDLRPAGREVMRLPKLSR